MKAVARLSTRKPLCFPTRTLVPWARNALFFRRNMASQYDYSTPYPPPPPPPQQFPPPNGHQMPPPPPRSRLGWLASKTFWGLIVLAVIPLAYREYWPHHTFPSSVAKLLRRGLWAESNKGEYDFQLALKYYIEALEEANNVGLDPISDEFTGIQLKIAEMYERLSMYEEAFLIYSEILTLYLTTLTAKPGSPNYKPLSMADRDHLIKKDLRLAIKIGSELENPNLMKPFMLTHLVIAGDQIFCKLDHGLNLKSAVEQSQRKAKGLESAPRLEGVELELPLKASKFGRVELIEQTDDGLVAKCDDGSVTKLEQNPDAWAPFADEYFQAQELYILSLILLHDVTGAFDTAVNVWEQMLLAGYGAPYRYLYHTCNIGSLAFNRAEQYEYGEIKLRKEVAKKMGVKDYLGLTSEQIEGSDKISRIDKEAYKELVRAKESCVNEAESTYQLVLTAVKENHQTEIDRLGDVITSETTPEVQNIRYIAETSALASYGLGVINLHLGKFDDAERYLREARLKARKVEYNALIDNIESELSKVFRERTLKNNT